ncbi:rhomboid-like protein [Actinomadura hibisca]|uniref:rhomboid-like protein n=1 Tax=Actinomadura hibisca TaxID=68565 RepID=UPI0008319B07|nr:rhomboid-like protein [Actinomadura hibisca]
MQNIRSRQAARQAARRIARQAGRHVRSRAAAWGYIGALGAAEAAYVLLDEDDRAAVAAWASTNLANLADHPVGSLVASALIPTEYPLLWLGLAGAGLLPVDARLGSGRAAVLFGLTHVLGTAVSQGIVAWRTSVGQLPETARHQLDTGPSFVVVPALVVAVGCAPWRWRVPAALGLAGVLPYMFIGLRDLDVAAVGHTVSMGVAVPLYLLLRGRPPLPVSRASVG